jgi:hypothetical protein
LVCGAPKPNRRLLNFALRFERVGSYERKYDDV